ncbi:MAG: hypothetical protein JW912_06125 [Sedimentisphaerales bacterium]|nr:hypothetical protein [Sedimentisphaerales bacterium]
MKKQIILAIIAVILPSFVLVTGCEEQQSTIKDKRVRLIANQNLELKKQLQEKDREIDRQKELVADCQAAKEQQKQTYDRSTEGLFQIVRSVSQQTEQIKQLTDENEQLKAEIAKLKGE